MAAHAGTIRIPTTGGKRRRHAFALLRERARARRRAHAARVQAINANRSLPSSIPGSEHTHLLRPGGF
jgi:hypothetical protein